MKRATYDGGPTIQLPNVEEPQWSHTQVCPPYCGPKAGAAPVPMPVNSAPQPGAGQSGNTPPSTDPLSSISGLLDQNVFGIPVKLLALGAAAYLLMRK